MKQTMIGCVCTTVLLVASQLLADDAPATKLKSGIDMSGLDTSVRPQDDFYRYVNGGWIDKTEIPADKSRWGSFYILREESAEQQRAIIEQLASEKDLPAGSGPELSDADQSESCGRSLRPSQEPVARHS